jgi:hypothetical protein
MLLIVAGPGITGHLGIQLVLSHIPPLAISIVITVEPILGALVGMAVGVEEAPHLYTLLGGPLTLAGCLFAVYGSWLRERGLPPAGPAPSNDAAASSNARHESLSRAALHTSSAAAGGPFSISDSGDGDLGLELAEMDRQMEWDEEDDAELLAFDAKRSDATTVDGGRSGHGNNSATQTRPLSSAAAAPSPVVAPLDADLPRLKQMAIASSAPATSTSSASRWTKSQYQLAPAASAVDEHSVELDLDGLEEDDAQVLYE